MEVHEQILIYKSLHLIFMVSWFAGLFYMVRLFIYHVEANEKSEPEKSILIKQFGIMEKRLWWIITTPAMVLTVVFGSLMLIANPFFLNEAYMWYKLGFVGLLLVYHFYCQKMYYDFKSQRNIWSSGALRMWNEVATLLLVIIIFIIIMKSSLNWIYASLGFVIVAVLLTLAIRMYKMIRNKEEKV